MVVLRQGGITVSLESVIYAYSCKSMSTSECRPTLEPDLIVKTASGCCF